MRPEAGYRGRYGGISAPDVNCWGGGGQGGTGTPAARLRPQGLPRLQPGAAAAEEPVEDGSISPPQQLRAGQDLVSPVTSGAFYCAAKPTGKICLTCNKEELFEPGLETLRGPLPPGW